MLRFFHDQGEGGEAEAEAGAEAEGGEEGGAEEDIQVKKNETQKNTKRAHYTYDRASYILVSCM